MYLLISYPLLPLNGGAQHLAVALQQGRRRGKIDAADIDAVYAHFGTGYNQWDVNGDGVVNQADVDALVKLALGTGYGDANLDRKINFADFQVLLDHWQMTGRWAGGDFNGDGVVNFLDFQDLLDYWNPMGYGDASVPEPATLGLLALGAVAILHRKSGKASRPSSTVPLSESGGNIEKRPVFRTSGVSPRKV